MELFTPEVWSKVGDLLLGVVIMKGYVLAALVLCLGFLLRRFSAAARSAFWTAGAAVLLLLPLIVGWVPVWELGLAEFPQQLFRAPAGAGGDGGPGLAAIGWLAVVWVGGSLLLAGRFALHLLRIARMTRRARPVSGRLAALVREVAAELGLARVRVALGPERGVPLTWGLWRPVVLLPREAAGWSRSLQRAVLRHELAHIERRDYLGLLAIELCRVFHWPNPLVWLLLRRARVDQELACDDAAIRSGIAPSEYARHLVAVARSFTLGTPRPVGALPVLGVSPLAARVEAAMERGANRGPLTRRTAVVTLALVAATAVPVAAASLWNCSEDPSSPPAETRAAPVTLAADPPRASTSVPAGTLRAALDGPEPLYLAAAADCPES